MAQQDNHFPAIRLWPGSIYLHRGIFWMGQPTDWPKCASKAWTDMQTVITHGEREIHREDVLDTLDDCKSAPHLVLALRLV